MATKFYASGTLVEDDDISAVPSALRELSGFNDGATVRYFQLFDGTPVNGVTVPMQSVRVPGGSQFKGDFRQVLLTFAIKPVFAFSTTPAIYTAGGGAVGWVEAVYED